MCAEGASRRSYLSPPTHPLGRTAICRRLSATSRRTGTRLSQSCIIGYGVRRSGEMERCEGRMGRRGGWSMEYE